MTALKNSDRLADLIRDILDFSKIESGQMTVYPGPADAGNIAGEAVESLQPWAQKKTIELTLTVSPGIPRVESDEKRTVQVLVNLLSNAIKFTPKGGRIQVRVQPHRIAGENFALFSVKDSGPGIPKKDHEKVFEKFVQVAAGERLVGGTGLGLAIAKALVHLQRGQMWLESEEGKGSTFLFTLPHHVAQHDEEAPLPPPPLPWWKRLLGLR